MKEAVMDNLAIGQVNNFLGWLQQESKTKTISYEIFYQKPPKVFNFVLGLYVYVL